MKVAQRFARCCETGDVDALLALLAPDVTLESAGTRSLVYGKARALRRPLAGASVVARFLIAVQRQAPAGLALSFQELGDGVDLIVDRNGRRIATLRLMVLEGRVRRIRILDRAESSTETPDS